MKFNPTNHPHRRYNPLTAEWVQISPHRTQRPWRGQTEKPPPETRPRYDSACYLCPGNTRAGGVLNPVYKNTFVFDNDFAAILPDTPESPSTSLPLLQFRSVKGACRVICFSPRHDLTLPEMGIEDIRMVVDVWANQTADLGAKYQWVQIFENKGAVMGASNPHPHGQIWAVDTLPNEPFKEDRQQQAYFHEHGRPLLIDYATLELEQRDRIVVENEHWLAVVPYWAIWPYETMLLPRRHVPRIQGLKDGERTALADILKKMLTRYDNLFETSFPYSMGWHGSPNNRGKDGELLESSYWQLHAHFYPPLLRSATIKKFMVGYEMLAEGQRDLTAEQAAEGLRSLPDIHYKDNGR